MVKRRIVFKKFKTEKAAKNAKNSLQALGYENAQTTNAKIKKVKGRLVGEDFLALAFKGKKPVPKGFKTKLMEF